MTEYIPQTSSSDRYTAARKVLARYDAIESDDDPGYHERVDAAIDALGILRALITPPGVHESEEQIADRIAQSVWDDVEADDSPLFTPSRQVREAALRGIRAGIQAAHETWECEDRPTQEQMLRWLGIAYMTGPGEIRITEQSIDKGN